jgi:hypothetical protein
MSIQFPIRAQQAPLVDAILKPAAPRFRTVLVWRQVNGSLFLALLSFLPAFRALSSVIIFLIHYCVLGDRFAYRRFRKPDR